MFVVALHRLCSSFEARADGIANVFAALSYGHGQACYLVVRFDGEPLRQGGVGFGSDGSLLLGSGNCFVQERIFLLIE